MPTDIFIIPLLAGLLILATHVPLGQRVLQRGIIFIDLAIAQIAGLGVVLAQLLDMANNSIGLQLLAGGSAILGALFLYWTDKRFSDVQEAIIGSTFVLAAAGSMLIMSQHPQGAEHISNILNGQIIWVDYQQLIWLFALYAVVLLLWYSTWQSSQRLYFYLLFAITVTASVQIAGVLLVFASLIFPAFAVRTLNGHKATLIGFLIGAAGYFLGFVVSLLWDLPAGPVIVWCLVACTLLTKLLLKSSKLTLLQ